MENNIYANAGNASFLWLEYMMPFIFVCCCWVLQILNCILTIFMVFLHSFGIPHTTPFGHKHHSYPRPSYSIQRQLLNSSEFQKAGSR